jgi:hypothetical protein
MAPPRSEAASARRRPTPGHPRLAGQAARLLGVCLLACGLGACARGKPEAETALQRRLTELEQENRELSERLARAEAGPAKASPAPRAAGCSGPETEGDGQGTSATKPAHERPPLTVVRLAPPGGASSPGPAPAESEPGSSAEAAASAGPDSVAVPDGHRPLLRLHGNEEPKIRTVPVGKDEPQARSLLRPAGAASGSEPKLA